MEHDDLPERPAAPESGYGLPGAPAPQPTGAGTLPMYDILPSAGDGDAAPPHRSVGRWTVAGVLAVVTALLVGGAVVGLRVLGGGGPQPEELVPSSAFAFAKIDLDPSAGQKLDAVRFLRSFPQLKSKVSEGSDLREAFFDAASPGASKLGIDYARDVKPWLGSRIGLAALPPAAKGQPPVLLAVLQVRDEGKARATLTRLKGASSLTSSAGFVVQDGWAVLAPSDAQAKAALTAGKKSPLSSAAHYSADIKRLGEEGIVTAWVDGGAASEALGGEEAAGLGGLGGLSGPAGLAPLTQLGFGAGSTSLQGRVVYALRFAGPKVLEVTGFATGMSAAGAQRAPVRQISTLPASTVVAVGVTGLDTMTDSFWKQLHQMAASAGGAKDLDQTVAELKTRYGIALPADLKTLFGRETTLALDSTGLSVENVPGVGVRAVTDPAAGTALAQKVVRASGGDASLQATARRTADGYVLATTPEQAARMAAVGTLGRRGDFKAALPDAGAAQVAVFVDVDGLVKAFAPDDSSRGVQALREIDAFGFTASTNGDSATYRIRLVIH